MKLKHTLSYSLYPVVVLFVAYLCSCYFVLAQAPPSPAPIPSIEKQASSSPKKKVSLSAPTSYPAYSLVVLQPTGFSSQPTWLVFTSINGNVVKVKTLVGGDGSVGFTGPPGFYLVEASNAAENAELSVTIQASPAPAPSPNPVTPTPVNPVVPAPPDPAPDPNSGFIYPPDVGQTSTNSDMIESISNVASKAKAVEDSKVLQKFYDYTAQKIELDGKRPVPGLQTIKDASDLVQREKEALFRDVPTKTLGQIDPETAKLVNIRLNEIMNRTKQQEGSNGVTFTPALRKAYVNFLRDLSAGFAKVR